MRRYQHSRNAYVAVCGGQLKRQSNRRVRTWKHAPGGMRFPLTHSSPSSTKKPAYLHFTRSLRTNVKYALEFPMRVLLRSWVLLSLWTLEKETDENRLSAQLGRFRRLGKVFLTKQRIYSVNWWILKEQISTMRTPTRTMLSRHNDLGQVCLRAAVSSPAKDRR